MRSTLVPAPLESTYRRQPSDDVPPEGSAADVSDRGSRDPEPLGELAVVSARCVVSSSPFRRKPFTIGV
jgi:hypothetical protein